MPVIAVYPMMSWVMASSGVPMSQQFGFAVIALVFLGVLWFNEDRYIQQQRVEQYVDALTGLAKADSGIQWAGGSQASLQGNLPSHTHTIAPQFGAVHVAQPGQNPAPLHLSPHPHALNAIGSAALSRTP